MADWPFLLWPDRRLTRPSEPVERVDDAIRALWDEMLDAMYAMPGVGLAAVQIGRPLRLAVIDCSESRDAPIRMANPELLWVSEETAREREGSPNLPGVAAEVERPAEIRVRYLDETGERVIRDHAGLWARSIQHQIDHHDGRLFTDRLRPVKRRMLLDRASKTRRLAGR